MFISAIKKGGNADLLEHGDNIPNEFWKDNKWYDSPAAHVGMVLPNIFLIYFGKDIPLGPIMSDDTKMAFERLGSGYEAWSIMAEVALENLSEIDMVIENATIDKPNNFVVFAKKNFCYELENVGVILTRTRSCLSVTLFQSDDYPVLAAELKRKFNLP